MSYDLTFKPGKNAPLSLKQQDALATALCTIHRPFKRTKLNFAQIAKQLKMTEVAARKQFSDCELTDTKSGIQVILTLKEASLTVPYSLKPKKAQDVFTIVAKIGEAFAEAGFTCRDPQLNRKVELRRALKTKQAELEQQR